MRKRLLLLLMSVALVLLGGWLTLWITGPRHRISKESIAQIEEGMTEPEVEAVLGVPPGDYSGGGSLFAYSFLPFIGKERPGQKFLDISDDLHAAEWAGDKSAVKVWFDKNGKAVAVASGILLLRKDSLFAKVRSWLGL